MRAGLILVLTLFSSLAQAGRTLVCLGDSLTAGYGLEESLAYPALLQGRLDKEQPGWTVINAGVSGDTSRGALGRLDWVLKGKPDLLFVAIGANDGLRGIKTEETEANLRGIVTRAQAAKVRVALGGMQLPTNYGPEYRQAFAAIFAKVAGEMKLPLLPFLLQGVGGVERLNQADGMHPTAEGQLRVAKNVGDFLLPQLKRFEKNSKAKTNPAKVIRSRRDLAPKETR